MMKILVEESSVNKEKLKKFRLDFKRLFFLLILFCLTSIVFAQELKPLVSDSLKTSKSLPDSLNSEKIISDSLYYEADSLQYYVNMEKIYLTSQAIITYGNATISSDSMMIDFNKEQALAMGHVLMQDNDQLVLGNQIYYDIDTETGFIINGASKFELGFYYGENMRKISDDIYDVDNGRFTTCDALDPHFDIRAKQMRVYRDKMVVGKPVVFYVNEFPVMALPFAAFSIKRGRESGILVPEPGYNPTDGKYLKNLAFYYVINDNADVTWSNDFTELKGWKTELTLPYKKRYAYTGNLDALFRKRVSNLQSYSYDWSFNHRHSQEFEDKSVFYMNLDFASSRQVWDNQTDVDKRLQQSITSSISYRKPFYNSTIYFSSAYSEDLTTNYKTLTLPTISYSLPSKPIYELFPLNADEVKKSDHWWKNFYYSWQAYGTHTGSIHEKSPSWSDLFYESTKDTADAFINEHHAGIRQNMSLSWNNTFMGWLKLNQGISLVDVIIDRDKNNNKLAHAYSYSTNAGAGLTIYGIKRFQNSKLIALRHILTPSVSYSWAPDFREKNNNMYSFSGVGVSQSNKQTSMSFSLDQKWQAKYISSVDNKERKLNDFLVWRTTTSMNLLNKEKPWNTINHGITLNTGTYEGKVKISPSQSFDAAQDPYDFNITSWRISLGLNLTGDAKYQDYFPIEKNEFVTRKFFNKEDTLTVQDKIVESIADLENLQKPGSWKINGSYDYQKDRKNHSVNTSFRTSNNFKITTNWALNYTNYFDLEAKKLISQNINLVRELHCWKLTFSYTKSATFWDYRIVLYNIKLPESLKLENTDHR